MEDLHDELPELPVPEYIMKMTDVYLCIKGYYPYDERIKASAKSLVEMGQKDIHVQVLANGNLELADDVVIEARTHYKEAGNVLD